MDLVWEIKGTLMVAQAKELQLPLAQWDVGHFGIAQGQGLADLLTARPEVGRQWVAGFRGVTVAELRGLGVSAG